MLHVGNKTLNCTSQTHTRNVSKLLPWRGLLDSERVVKEEATIVH
jgi:hypothetical protein